MPMYNKMILSKKAKEISVVRDTFEKVCRLRDVLRFFDESTLLRDKLALKGGTAINLLFYNLPRLSVDIDLDFCENISKDEMFIQRNKITDIIEKFMSSEGYIQSPKSKNYHSLDSFIYDYTNSTGMKDNIKIEINYSLRSHVLPTNRIKLNSEILDGDFKVNTISYIEIYASKTIALMTRAAARDLYDMNYMVCYGMFEENQLEVYRKCVIFYLAIATENTPIEFDFKAVDNITKHKIFTDLRPVIRDRDSFSLDVAKKAVKLFLEKILYINDNELKFLENFRNGYYCPELIFDSKEILANVSKHPMAIWKTERNRGRDILLT